MKWYKGWIIMTSLSVGMVAEAMEDESDEGLKEWHVVTPVDYHPNSPANLVAAALEATHIQEDKKANRLLPVSGDMTVDREGGQLSDGAETSGSTIDGPGGVVKSDTATAARAAAEEEDDHPTKRVETLTDSVRKNSHAEKTRRGKGGRKKKRP